MFFFPTGKYEVLVQAAPAVVHKEKKKNWPLISVQMNREWMGEDILSM